MNKHILIIENRSSASISGVRKADSFSPEEIAVYTEEGDLIIKGRNLEVDEFNENKGELKNSSRLISKRRRKTNITSYITKTPEIISGVFLFLS